MDKTVGRARRRQLFAAVSVLGVSLGMADVAHAAKDDVTSTQTSHKGQTSLKIDSQQTGQHSLKLEGQNSHKVQSSYKEQGSHKVQSSYKEQGSYKENAGQLSQKGVTTQQKVSPQ